MWPHCHTLLPAANLITVPVKYISTDQVSAREDFNNLPLCFQPTISISKWFRPLPGITYDFSSKKTNFYSNQIHMLNILSSPLRYNEVETVSIFHLNKKSLSFEIKLAVFPGWVHHLVRGTLGDSCSGQEFTKKIIILLSFCALLF